MKRDLRFLGSDEFDVVIVGGGIHGAACLREAALCGLRAVLLEQDDFCGATSANSLKIIHGGLRYLQQLDVLRMRESITARRSLLRTAPHLVYPQPFIMPTTGRGLKSRSALAAALAVNDLVSWDRNRGADPARLIASGRTVSREDCLRLLPGIRPESVTGGAIWHDACAYSTERLGLAMIRSACALGASAANYVKVSGFMIRGDTIEGVQATDTCTGDMFDIRAPLVINNTGPWADCTLSLLPTPPRPLLPALALGMNFIVRGWPIRSHATGLMSQARSDISRRLLFFVPWKEWTIAGTYYRPHFGSPDAMKVTDRDIELFLMDINTVHPDVRFQREDIVMIHAGLLPATSIPSKQDSEPDLAHHSAIVDHGARDGIHGVISVVGVKYTTAVTVAAKTVALARARLARSVLPSPSLETPLEGGAIRDFQAYVRQAEFEQRKRVTSQTVAHLIRHYGTDHRDVIDLAAHDPSLLGPISGEAASTPAEVLYAARTEMAVTLTDIVRRRTDIGTGTMPDAQVLRRCADIAAKELGWDERRKARELSDAATPPWHP